MAPKGLDPLATYLNYSDRLLQAGLSPPRRPRSSPRWLTLLSGSQIGDLDGAPQAKHSALHPKSYPTFVPCI